MRGLLATALPDFALEGLERYGIPGQQPMVESQVGAAPNLLMPPSGGGHTMHKAPPGGLIPDLGVNLAVRNLHHGIRVALFQTTA